MVACTPELKTAQPARHTQSDVHRRPVHTRPTQRHRSQRERGSEGERERVEALGIEDRDHDDGADVVDDGQREQEHLERRRHARPEQRKDAEREGDVGRHRDAPPVAPRTAADDRGVDRRRDDHPADRGEHRQRRGPTILQLAGDELALDLEADDEEEQRHQAVVDEVLQVLVDAHGPDLDDDLGVPDGLVAVGPPRVRPDQRGGGGDDEQHAARRLGVHEAPDGQRQHPANRSSGAPGPAASRSTRPSGGPCTSGKVCSERDRRHCRPGFPAHRVSTVPEAHGAGFGRS